MKQLRRRIAVVRKPHASEVKDLAVMALKLAIVTGLAVTAWAFMPKALPTQLMPLHKAFGDALWLVAYAPIGVVLGLRNGSEYHHTMIAFSSLVFIAWMLNHNQTDEIRALLVVGVLICLHQLGDPIYRTGVFVIDRIANKLEPLDLEINFSDIKDNAAASRLERALNELGLEGKFKISNVINGFRTRVIEIKPSRELKLKHLPEPAELKFRMKVESLMIKPTSTGVIQCIASKPESECRTLRFAEFLDSDEWKNSTASLPIICGATADRRFIVKDLTEQPHMLIGGTSGGGKSVLQNGIIYGLMQAKTPEQVQFVMIDPKEMELTLFEKSKHLAMPIAYTPDALRVLTTIHKEMEWRQKLFKNAGVVNLGDYNKIATKAKSTIPDNDEGLTVMDEHRPLPRIVLVVDEFASINAAYGKKTEGILNEIGQKSRAAGIHMILTTQRPSEKAIDGDLKTNIGMRISLRATDWQASKIILDKTGAEHLMNKGDMLVKSVDEFDIIRTQSPLLKPDEIKF